MAEIIIFAGTTEGRLLSEYLCGKGILHDLCVATEYGEQVLTPHPCAQVHRGRMDRAQMELFFRQQRTGLVIDATHPYAAAVTNNIRQACAGTGTEYLRLLRDAGMSKAMENVMYFATTEECAAYLTQTAGTVFLTTGSKDLPVFAGIDSLRPRLIARVLPGSESIAICEKCGLPGRRIIAMQGPFSEEMNKALFQNYGAAVLVTKASGRAGGFEEKLSAARELGMTVCIIGRPVEETGFSLQEVCARLEAYAPADGTEDANRKLQNKPKPQDKLKQQGKPEPQDKLKQQENRELPQISLIGCGMGNHHSLTIEAAQALEQAKLVFGAKRLLEGIVGKTAYPYYLAKDILPRIREYQTAGGRGDIAILLSGDTGFYSGAAKLEEALQDGFSKGTILGEMKVYPGISSISQLAADLGESYQEAKLLSVHGRGDASLWGEEVCRAVAENRKTCLLLSGIRDLHTIAGLLSDIPCTICGGYCMGSEQEEIFRLTPEQCLNRQADGLYTLMIINEAPQKKCLTPGLADETFLRDKVPMTKEEVRTVSISRLQLHKGAVVYDVGSGTGSVAVEAALLDPSIRVFAIERKPEAAALIRRNLEHFHLHNVTLQEGYAPETLKELPPPTHAFIGGTGGQMKEILTVLQGKNPRMRIVANAVSLETLQELLAIPKQFAVEDYQISMLSATRIRTLAGYHMQQAENPVWICSFTLKEED